MPDAFLATLRRHVARPYQHVTIGSLGVHLCSLCPKDRPVIIGRTMDRKRACFSNVLIPTPVLLYVTPELVVHYVEDHAYRPPEEFIEAVMACPEQGSERYLALLRQLFLDRFSP